MNEVSEAIAMADFAVPEHDEAGVVPRSILSQMALQYEIEQYYYTEAALLDDRRFDEWLAALELARDDEARSQGIEGADLAAALLGSVRFQLENAPTAATLIGQRQALPARVARLLQPLPESAPDRGPTFLIVAGGLGTAWLVAIALGLVCGERLIGYLLALSR